MPGRDHILVSALADLTDWPGHFHKGKSKLLGWVREILYTDDRSTVGVCWEIKIPEKVKINQTTAPPHYLQSQVAVLHRF